MDEEVSGFDWDHGNREKCQKHGVTVEEIEGVFLSGPHVASDLKHSAEEDRFIAIGRTGQDRLVFVAFTYRTKFGRRLIRPVSARYMHAKEIESYEAQGS